MGRFAFINNEFVDLEFANVNIQSHIFNYGTGAFFGIRGFWNDEKQQLFLFRPFDHFKRLIESAQFLKIEKFLTEGYLEEVVIRLLKMERYRQDCYLRGVIFKDIGTIGAKLYGVSSQFSLYSLPMNSIYENKRIKLCISKWKKIPSHSIPAKAKMCGSYINSALAKSEALDRGFDEAILLDSTGFVMESSASNIFIVKNNILYTPKLEGDILAGITRDTVIELAKNQLNIVVCEDMLTEIDILEADEIFLTGTGLGLVEVEQVEDNYYKRLGDSSIISRLKEIYKQLVSGNLADLSTHYCYPVY